MPGLVQRKGGNGPGALQAAGAFHPGGAGVSAILCHGETEGEQIGLHVRLRNGNAAGSDGSLAVNGEIVDVAAQFHLRVQSHGMGDAHVVDRVVVVTVEIRGQDAGDHAHGGLVVALVQPELVQHGIQHTGQRGVHSVERVEEEPGTDDGAEGIGVDEGASVVGRGHRGDGMDLTVSPAARDASTSSDAPS